MEKLSKLKVQVSLLLVIQVILIVFFKLMWDINIILSALITAIEIAMLVILFKTYEKDLEETNHGITRVLGTEAKEAFLFGETGMLAYDDNYVISWMSEIFEERGFNRVGKKLLVWLPETDDLISGKAEEVEIKLDNHIYLVHRKEDAKVLFFKDITETKMFKDAYEDEQIVVGLINLDNYEESTRYEDEKLTSSINNSIRQPVVEWCKQHGLLLRRLKNDRYMVVLNESLFKGLVENRFSILNTVRRASQELDVSITLSMAFARGTSNFEELDEMVVQLLDLAQSRGGDQVAIRRAGEDVKFFGGSSEAIEKRSRVRVRIMANTLKDLIQKSGNVIICCHKEADFDCMGGAIAMSRIVQAYGKGCCIIAKTGGIEEKLSGVIEKNKAELLEHHQFVTENEAINQYRDDTLVIMVDHHSLKQSNGSHLLENAKKIAIFDHHRRSADLEINPILVYIEAGASSTSELVSEFIPYLSNRIELNELEANIMYAGMIIDTNRFKVRTGTRTFEAAGMLRSLGADPLVVDEYLKDTYAEFTMKSIIMNNCEQYEKGIIIAPVTDKVVSRSMMSQVADNILQIKDIQASFVIAMINENQVAISARSRGKVNVQRIMENMHGGGHLTAAALQREGKDVVELKNELIDAISRYFEEVEGNESNPTE
ncbi:DHH family phosphoesterase [Anaerorhabdus furcosa]|uniref:Cyclic-di-AMP phosphodiesterase n=1 Tax=Anaerorhabdus furcosa TaxID=118967 RepID=A0A1T4K5D4_9FIRM|nr:DHH family phosphoesterase [Anaerorhabdus furcosa]SJZ37650.1 c-di-AMP phosphodiesterase, consists of a GGDEF-like and DHH domains [Anaerorhabdus furcosa]